MDEVVAPHLRQIRVYLQNQQVGGFQHRALKHAGHGHPEKAEPIHGSHRHAEHPHVMGRFVAPGQIVQMPGEDGCNTLSAGSPVVGAREGAHRFDAALIARVIQKVVFTQRKSGKYSDVFHPVFYELQVG
ncbi:hypothetical protein SDC9_109953 [bioreactor metagenome]|uniref:Uncharacterized protein n=1 Tax=bioreactor metagenome TaxID=1076179 RepID=A0A645BIP7_9ZZZZ